MVANFNFFNGGDSYCFVIANVNIRHKGSLRNFAGDLLRLAFFANYLSGSV